MTAASLYWSSTEVDPFFARSVFFFNGTASTVRKDVNDRVRPVRGGP